VPRATPARPNAHRGPPDPRDRLADLVGEGADRLLLPGEGTLVLAVSGGPDSMALLHGAARLVERGDRAWRLLAAHLDHGLRSSSGDDARFVEDEAARLGVKVRARRVDVAAVARQEREGLESAGRHARYRFFGDVAGEAGPGALICTAHTADDQAETVLLHLARGTGLAGLRGIAARRGRIVRPLLHARRAELRDALDAGGLAYRIDPSNADRAFARNRARAELVPLLESLHPGAVAAIARLAGLAAEEERLLAGLAALELGRRRAPDGTLDWSDPPEPGMARRVLRLAIGWPAPPAERIGALIEAAASGRGGLLVELGRGRSAMVRRRRITFLSTSE
jgi:tRNA(Ile)-lysidine synthase